MTPSSSPNPLVALYARVSTEDQSCDLQLNEMRDYCQRRGWPVYGEFVDTGWSGAKADRPQLAKIMKAASLHKFDAIMVWKLDRFGRSVANFVGHLEELESYGVRFIAITQSVDTDHASPSSRLLMQILAAMAEFERSMIRERVKAGMNAAAKRGTHCGRKKLVLDRDQVAALHLQGKTIRQISAALGVPKTSVDRILKQDRAA